MTSANEGAALVKKFQILDRVSNVLSMILDGTDPATVSSSVSKLHARFHECEQLLENLPGGEMSKQEQEDKIKELTASLAKRKALVAKYRNLEALQKIADVQEAETPAESDGQQLMGANTTDLFFFDDDNRMKE